MRATILKEIDRLEFKHCKNCPLTKEDRYYEKYCIKGCEIGDKIAEFGQELIGIKERHHADKVQEIMSKGKKMTNEEILYLRQRRVPRKEIAEIMEIKNDFVKPFFDNIEGVVSV